MVLQNDICNVKVSIDSTFTLESTDNKPYDLVINPYHMRHNDIYTVFSIQIDLFYKELSVALIGDFHSYDIDCAILEDNVLTVLQNNAIIQIDVKSGIMLSFKEFDCLGCNYGIYKVTNGYIIYGEIDITMLDLNFEKKWSFSGSDIFVSVSGKRAFELCEKSIKLYDFEDNFYEIDYMGNLIAKA